MSCLLEISTGNLNPLDVPKETPLALCKKKIQNKLNLIYLNNDGHTHMDRANGSTDILDMAFISQNLAIHDIQFQIGADLGSDQTYPLKSQSIQHHIGIHLLTPLNTNLTRPTEKYLNQHSMKR